MATVDEPGTEPASSSGETSREPRAASRDGSAGRRAPRAGVLLLLLCLAALAFPLFFQLPYHRDLAIKVLLHAMLAQAWNILAGYCGQVSLGHAVFFGTGAYTSSALQMTLGVNPWLGMVAGVVLAVALSQVIGYPCFRLRGHYFAIATIAIGEIVHTLAINWEVIGGARGLTLPIRRDSLAAFQFHGTKYLYYYIILALMALCFYVTWRIEHARLGYYLKAIREDPDAAQSVGIPITRHKLIAIAISAGFMAVGGTFYAQYVLYLDPDSVFPLSLSILVCLLTVVGGSGTLWGPLVGSALMLPLSEFTRVKWGGTGSAVDLLIYGALLTIVAVFQPAGLVGMFRRWGRR